MNDQAPAIADRQGHSFLLGTYAAFRHELRLLLYSPASYGFMIAFLLSQSVAVFLVANFYQSDEASTRLMILFLPWTALVLVPILAVFLGGLDSSGGARELTLSLPLGSGSQMAGKFFAGLVVILVTLLFSLAFPATIAFLGAPDWGVILASYLGAILLLSSYLAVSLLCVVLIKDPFGGFALALSILFVLLILGWETFSRALTGFLPPDILGALTHLSPRTWLMRLGTGLVEAAALVYFLVVIMVCLIASAWILDRRRRAGVSPWPRARSILKGMIGLGLALLAISVASAVDLSLDLTAEREHSLHPGTRSVLEAVPEGTTATFFWSADESSVPTALKSHARRIKNLLSTMSAESGGKLTLKEVNPRRDSEAEIQAMTDGIMRVPMSSGDSFFLGLKIESGEKSDRIPYIDMRRDRFLEYDIALMLNGLTKEKTPRIGIISPHLPSHTAQAPREGMSFLDELKRAYDIAVIPYFRETLPENLDTLLLIDASILRREMLYEIDQFVMNGGSLIVLMDPYLRLDKASNAANPSPSVEIDDISDLLMNWGIRYQGDRVVGDLQFASPVSDGENATLNFPFWLRITGKGLSTDHPVTADLNEMLLVDPGALEILEPTTARPLITTTDQSAAVPRAGYGAAEASELALGFSADGQSRVIAAAMTGPFESAFAALPAGLGESSGPDRRHMQSSPKEARVFVVADVDWIFDPFSLQTVTHDGGVSVRPLNDNLVFLLNLLEYAAGDPALLSIRSRGRLNRPFDRVQELARAAAERFQEEEVRLAGRLAALETRLQSQLGDGKSTDLERLSAEDLRDLQDLRDDILKSRAELRSVRRQIRAEVAFLGQWLTAINLLAGPIMVLLFWLAVRSLRRHSVRAFLPENAK